jgi:hypothetical protein
MVLKKDAKYGVHLNIAPARTAKAVMIHRSSCVFFKPGKANGKYTFNKFCRSFKEAVEKTSAWALEWHAPIKFCSHCLRDPELAP